MCLWHLEHQHSHGTAFRRLETVHSLEVLAKGGRSSFWLRLSEEPSQLVP